MLIATMVTVSRSQLVSSCNKLPKLLNREDVDINNIWQVAHLVGSG